MKYNVCSIIVPFIYAHLVFRFGLFYFGVWRWFRTSRVQIRGDCDCAGYSNGGNNILCLSRGHIFDVRQDLFILALFTYAAIENKDKTDDWHDHEHEHKSFKRQPRASSTASEFGRLVRFLLHHDEVLSVGDKQVVVNILGDTWKEREVCSLEFVVHVHEPLHDKRIAEHVDKIRLCEYDP
tara:strand:+ start:143 stop:685 length:543 start_codon:yes stop_codon:yes gene_type:complete